MIFAYTYIYPNNFNLFVHPLTIKVNKKNLLKKKYHLFSHICSSKNRRKKINLYFQKKII